MTATLSSLMNNFRPHPNSQAGRMARSDGVTESEDFKRIRDLPRRPFPRDLTELMTAAYKTPQGTQTLRPAQAAVLTDFYDWRGAVGRIPAGGGKTLIGFLAPLVMGARRPLLLLPANLKKKTEEHDLPFYRQHWRMPPALEILSYEKLQTANNANALFDYAPDLVIADEAHFLRNRKTARWRRFARFFTEHPQGNPPPLLVMSATFTTRSLRDYWHIVKLALPNQCPLPLHWNRLQEWADAIDADVPEEKRVAPGALLHFCAPGENVRQGFQRRFNETPGVVAVSGSGFTDDEHEPGMEIHELDPGEPPSVICDAFQQLRSTWCTPGGEEISDAVSMWRHAGSLAQGFYLKWVWPDGIPDTEWLVKRKAWKKFVRHTLQHNRCQLDSELQVWNACLAGHYDCEEFAEWQLVKDRYGPSGPPTEAVWISDWFVEVVRDFINRQRRQGHKFIIWVRNPDMGERLGQVLEVPYYGGGDDGIIERRQTCVASQRAHGTGKNLQAFSKNLFVVPPLGGSQFEQLLARTHRSGQEADVVQYYFFLHCKELVKGFQTALNDARYIEDSTGSPQRLLRATMNLLHGAQDLAELAQGDNPLWW